jgi:hypothetical protein
MESLIGVVGKDYVLIACDGATVRSVVKFKDTEDKIYKVFGNPNWCAKCLNVV